MALSEQPVNHGYTQGHSNATIATHLQHTAETEAAFLLPHIKKTDQILDIGCGPGTITTGFATYASEGGVIGVDVSQRVLQKAKELAAQGGVPTDGPGSAIFEQGNILERLPYDDDAFDIIYCGQLFGHLQMPDQPLQALKEIRRILRVGGILATRDGAAMHFFPPSYDLDRLWAQRQQRVFMGKHVASTGGDPTWTIMPALFRQAGFDVDHGKVVMSGGARVWSGEAARRMLADRAAAQLTRGDPYYQNWLDAGITDDEIAETLAAVENWAEKEDGWCAALQSDMLAWK